MKSGFKDPIAPKIKKTIMNSPWNFDAPQYDERTSVFVTAGTNYGTGFNQPVGTKGEAKGSTSALPMDRTQCAMPNPTGPKREIINDQ